MSRINVSLGRVLAEVVWPWPLAAKPGLNPSPRQVGCWVVIHVVALGQVPLLCCTNVAAGHHPSASYSSLRDFFRASELSEKLYKHENVFTNAYV